jgi:hypothetical protein
MKKLTAVALAAAVAPAAVAISAAPAQASDCTAVYPPGQAWKLRISPSYLLVNKGTEIRLTTRLVRGNLECGPGERIGIWARNKGATVFKLARATQGDFRGLSAGTFRPQIDFRWYTNHNRNNVEVARSITGLVQTR